LRRTFFGAEVSCLFDERLLLGCELKFHDDIFVLNKNNRDMLSREIC
jgi:hypothetical protein